MGDAMEEKNGREIKLDPLLLNQIRFAMLIMLAREGEMKFTELRDACEATDGSVGAHLRKLENAGYVSVLKSFANRRPMTQASLTSLGRDRLREFSENTFRIFSKLPLVFSESQTQHRHS